MATKQEQFINDLVQFYRNRGISSAHPSQFVARLNGKNVDLSELYARVLELGGSYKVNQFNLWDDIYFKLFKINYIGANFAVALRQIFNRYLLQYEKSCNGNFSSEQWNEDDDDENSAIFSNSHHHSGQYVNNHQNSLNQPPICDYLNNITESNGQIHNDSKLYCSLLSGLPNELKFAYDVATILTNSHRFDWHNDFKFINILVESIKSYCCVCDHFDEELQFGRKDFTEEDEILHLENVIKSNFQIKNKSNENFDTNENDKKRSTNKLNGISKLDEFEIPKLKKNAIEIIEHKCSCFLKFWHQTCSNEELLNLVFYESLDEIDFDSNVSFKDLPTHLCKKIEQRITLIADMIRNISFTYDQNESNLVAMTPLLKFLTLLFCSDNVKFTNISLDILSNIAPALSFSFKRPYEHEFLALLHILFKRIVETSLISNNIHDTTKSFEIMARYISATSNEANLLLEAHFQNDRIYERITQLLTCHYDIALILALLEFCLALSESRPNILINNDSRTFLKILVNLLNCQTAQYFTTGALQKIKIIDTRPNEEVAHRPTQFILNHDMSSVTTTTTIIPHLQVPTKQEPQIAIQSNSNVPTNNMINHQIQQQQQQIIQKPIMTPIPATTLNLNVLDNESFAINWLRTTYEEKATNFSLKINDIYAEYVKHCCRNSRRNVIAAQSFNFLLKRCFPQCQINQQQQSVEGLNPKITMSIIEDQKKPLMNNTVNNQMSPILKAHLSTPPKALLPDGTIINATTPASAAPQTPTNASTLIKSLLANKLRNNQQQQQQQQHQQQMNNIAAIQQTTTPIASNLAPSDVSKPVVNESQPQQQKNIIISQNSPATSFALTAPTVFGNNIIVPSSIHQSLPQGSLQGSQQIFLVRTFITGQQNSNTPVRLLLPASMIQQRLPVPQCSAAPTGAININGLTTGTPLVQTAFVANNSIQTNPMISQQSSVSQQHFLISQATTSTAGNAVPVIVSTNVTIPSQSRPAPVAATTPIMKNSSIANSSPLLNVLLDKGKLPDFPNQRNSSVAPTIASITLNTPNTTPQPQIIPTAATVPTSVAQPINTTIIPNQPPTSAPNTVIAQPKMIFLAPNNQTPTVKPTSVESSAKLIVPDVKPTPNITARQALVNNIRLTTPASTAPVTIVNGDLKTPGKMNILTPTSAEISCHTKHSLENQATELNKRLKLNEPSQVVQTKSNGISLPTQEIAKISAPNVQIKMIEQQKVCPNNSSLEFECQWNNCQMRFSRASDVFYHVHSQHIMTPSCPNFMNCLWGGAEGRGPGCLSKRPKLSLLTHLQDYHCNPNALKQELERKKQIASTGSTNIILPAPPAHPGYAQNAAMLAIRRYTNKTMQEASEPITPLTPLTVSIRLTTALILRNLAKRSHFIKKSLELFESLLCEISAAEDRDESRTIAQCLAVLNEHK
uniref:Uncharacterized protein LOC113798053 n=1 Tax=Dermatophagoides pteronyssinus TaxID=6956 RepID=A0A6P6YGG0_DERPT|nr:uncharacterized protein LOC113798053 [Dermatophagoides pteronyssinus]